MTRRKSRLFQKFRKPLSWVSAMLLLAVLLWCPMTWKSGSLPAFVLELLSILLLLIATSGRLYSSIFISGYKSVKCVEAGPYSLVRNPLYFFSFIGICGLGIASQNMVLLIVMIVLFLPYYRIVIHAEEKTLRGKLGREYEDYLERIPRLIPRIAPMQLPNQYEVDLQRLSKAFLDFFGFWGVYASVRIIVRLHDLSILPL